MIGVLEGGWVETNDPRDPGGDTYAGVTKKAWQATGHSNWPPSREEVYAFAIQEYGTVANQLDEPLATMVLQAAYNLGPKHATQLLQVAAGVWPVDGYFGPKSAAAVKALDAKELTRIYAAVQRAHYVEHNGLNAWDSRGLYERPGKLIAKGEHEK